MPIQLFWGIVVLAFTAAFGCPKCQTWNQPNVVNIKHVDSLIKNTPIATDTGADSIINVQRIYQAHKIFQHIYDDIVKCSGLRADTLWENMDFYIADRFDMKLHIHEPNGTTTEEDADGYWDWNSNEVVLSIYGANDNRAVGHEILHALLDKYGIVKRTDMDKHPDSWFGNRDGKCKGLVRAH